MKRKNFKTLLGEGARSLLLSFFVVIAMVFCSAGGVLGAVTYDVQWTEWDPTTGVLTLKAGKSGTEGVPTATSGNIWLCDEANDGWQKRKYGKTDFKNLYPFSTSNSEGLGDGIYKLVKRFVVDKSYKSFPTKSINFFFRDMENLEIVEGLQNIGMYYIETYDFANGEKGSLCRLFKGCKNLKFIQGMETWTTSPTHLFEMFSGCEKLLWVDISGIYTDYVVNMDNMFYNCKNMRKAWVRYSDFNQFYHGSYNNMFYGCDYVNGLFEYMPKEKQVEEYVVYYDGILAFFNDRHRMDASRYPYSYSLNEGTNQPNWYTHHNNVETVWFPSCCHYVVKNTGYYERDVAARISPSTCYAWFKDCSRLKMVYGWNNISISAANSLAYMFYGCSQLTSAALNNMTTTAFTAQDMSYMFYNCSGLYGSISFDMEGDFHSSMIGRRVQNLSYMFYGCSRLSTIYFGDLYGSYVTNTKSMFEGCSWLKKIIMYSGSPSFSKVTNSTDMFKGCTDLVGGCGTVYDANHTDITYAREDLPSIDYYSYKGPGYFSTYKNNVDYRTNFDFAEGFISKEPSTVYFYTADDDDFSFTIKLDDYLSHDGFVFRDIVCYGGNTSVSGRTITVKKGSYSDVWCMVRFKCPIKRVYLKNITETYTGEEIPFNLYVSKDRQEYTLVNNTDYYINSIKIKQGDTYTAVSSIKQAGKYQISVSGRGYDFTGSFTFELTVKPLELTIVPENTTKTYGDPDPEINYSIEGNLVNGDQLTGALSYDKSSGENTGKYPITIGTLNNPNYNLTLADGEFEILQKKVTNPVIHTSSTKYPYTGSAVTPTVYVFDGTTMIPASEYSVSYKNNVNLGQGMITITDNPNGNYDVSGVGYFTIADASEFCKVTIKNHDISAATDKIIYVIKDQLLPYDDLKEEGYTLLGLYEDEGCYTLFNYQSTTISSDDKVLHAKWQINQHRLKFIVDGTVVSNEMVDYGTPITIPNQPAETGKTFTWNIDIPQTMPDYDIVAEGAYVINKYTLKYTLDGKEYQSDEIEYGTPLTILSNPAPKEGYTFSGWNPSSLPATMPDNDIQVVGSFIPNEHIFQLTYIDPDGTEQTKKENIAYGTKIKDLLPKFTGYVFISRNDMLETMPDYNYSLSGYYEIGKYTLTYMLNDEVYKKQTEVLYGTTITPLAAPKAKTGHSFTGWEGEPETMPDHDVVVRGSLKANEHTITYMIDGEVYKTVKVSYGSTISAPTKPYKSGYTFSGWSEIPETMPDKDLTITGSFTKNGKTPVSALPEIADAAKVWSYNGTIYIETLPDTKYTIADINGRIITTSTTKSTHDEININQSGILIVIIGNQSFKVIM